MQYIRTLVLFVVIVLALPAAAFAGERVALVVGVSTYRYVPSLDNPANDAVEVARALRGTGFAVTELSQPEQLTRDAIGSALVNFRKRAETAEAAIIYFAGHGVEVNGTNWLLPSDVSADSPDDLEVKAIPASSAINAVRGASTIRLVILDACRDNPFTANPGWASEHRSFGARGLGRELSRADNVVLLLATQPGTKASDGKGSGNSPFARALSSTLSTEGMQIAELPGMISRRMREDDRVEQRPDQQGIFDDARWMFRQTGVALPSPAPPIATMPQAGSPVSAESSFFGIVSALALPSAQPRPSVSAASLIRECDRLAANEFDPDRPIDAPFVSIGGLLPVIAIPACARAVEAAPGDARMLAQLGRAHFANKDYATARPLLERASGMGSALAMYNFGVLYRDANGVAQNYAEARRWFEQAVAKGSSVAMTGLGSMYGQGQGVLKDHAQARRWFERAAAKGEPYAMHSLGTYYRDGLGVAKDMGQARSWFEQAAAKGHEGARQWLAQNPQ